MTAGPLCGTRVVEFAAMGPGPFAAMLLADLGADVIRIDRPAPPQARGFDAHDLANRGKRTMTLDLKTADGHDIALRLIQEADVLIEGFRPGVMEKLGLGPEECAAANPRLVYGRMTGWGQDGPLAPRAGHDIDYISLTGALWAAGRRDERPTPALNLVGDFGGGAMFLVVGVLSALLERGSSGRGQVIDAAMVDGAALLTLPTHAMRGAGLWIDERGSNILDSGAPFYEVYECADGGYVSVGAIEQQFYEELVRRTGFREGRPDAERYARDRVDWDTLKAEWAALFATRERDHWVALARDTDACLAPVLSWTEAMADKHLTARGTFVEVEGTKQPAPAPRFSRTPGSVRHGPRSRDSDTAVILAELGANQNSGAASTEQGRGR
jgi:alpha-methylacyl-CoA racemase